MRNNLAGCPHHHQGLLSKIKKPLKNGLTFARKQKDLNINRRVATPKHFCMPYQKLSS
nr:MAG TPA: hypothetical protein [Bacteriophage sp.]